MPLDERAIRTEAKRRGVDEEKAVAEARRIVGERAPASVNDDDDDDSAEAKTPGRPSFERLLLGVLPFIRVRELRTIWLGLDEPLPDDEMTCGAFAAKYGGGAAAAPAAAGSE